MGILSVKVDGVIIEAGGIPPWKYEKIGRLHIVVDAAGINWTRFPGKPGAVSFATENRARAVVVALAAENRKTNMESQQ